MIFFLTLTVFETGEGVKNIVYKFFYENVYRYIIFYI